MKDAMYLFNFTVLFEAVDCAVFNFIDTEQEHITVYFG